MTLPAVLRDRLRLPVIGSPLFIISGPDLVIAQCKAGIVGSFPALNARPISQLDEWLAEITETLAAYDRAHPDAPSAPFAVNQIVHKTNNRLEEDVELCAKYRVPVIIIGTLCFSHTARSCSSRLLDLCTIWLTANGADGRSGCALS